MAITGQVNSPQQYQVFLMSQTGSMGTAETSERMGVILDLNEPIDIVWDNVTQDRTKRIGQQIKRGSDHYASLSGSFFTADFEWVVSSKEGLDKLMSGISEDTTSAYEIAGDFTPSTYLNGSNNANLFTLVIADPIAANARTLHSCMLTNLNFTWDLAADGGRLKVGGTLYSGYQPSIGAHGMTVSDFASLTSYAPVFTAQPTKTVGGNDVVIRSMEMSIGYPGVRVGHTSTGTAEVYSRSGEYTCGGSVSVKYDNNSDEATAEVLSSYFQGATKAIVFGGQDVTLSIPQAVYTGYAKSFDDEGVFVDIPFEATADGSAQNLYSITVS
ncbi:MAG: hypothetical protein H8D94_01920 [Candidatus Pelagibacter sp.]|nr:hypothetical protein [Candidatus Pelagibacter sp.]